MLQWFVVVVDVDLCLKRFVVAVFYVATLPRSSVLKPRRHLLSVQTKIGGQPITVHFADVLRMAKFLMEINSLLFREGRSAVASCQYPNLWRHFSCVRRCFPAPRFHSRRRRNINEAFWKQSQSQHNQTFHLPVFPLGNLFFEYTYAS